MRFSSLAIVGVLYSVSNLSTPSEATSLRKQSPFPIHAASCAGTSKSDCNANAACTWCESGAIPSKCYNAEDAKKLPPGVFNCVEATGEVEREEVSPSSSSSFTPAEKSDYELTLKHSALGKGVCDPNVNQASGYLRLQKENKHYFYWFFEARNDPENAPVVLWMTGGPGCSSEVALFGENGPCKVNADGSDTTLNPYSWNTNANIIYIDQPAGTGFSFGTFDHGEKGVAQDMYFFLTEFFDAFPQFQKNRFYIFGESYGGHYVPATSHRVWLGNQRQESPVHINLQGVAVGNGLTDPEIQYKYYPDMAFNSTSGPSRISRTEYWMMKHIAVPACIKLIKQCNEGKDDSACTKAYTLCNLSLVQPITGAGWNPYDIREKCKVPPLCYDFSNVGTYLAREEVMEAIGVDNTHPWSSCNKMVTVGFLGDWMKNYQNQIPDLLESKIPVLIYAGDVDFICNWIGNKEWTLALDWDGHDGYNSAPDLEWKLKDGSAGGKARSHEGLTFLQVYQAGHMVPLDKPVAALEMLNHFIGVDTSASTSAHFTKGSVKQETAVEM